MNGKIPTISLLGKEAAAGLAKLEALCFSTPWPEEQYERILEQTDRLRREHPDRDYLPPYAIFGLNDHAGRLAAYVSLSLDVTAGEAEIFNIAVLPELRRTGLGKGLLATVLDRLKGQGVRVVFLEVRTGNAPAIGLYEGLGFKRVGLRKKYYADTGEDALVLRLDMDMDL